MQFFPGSEVFGERQHEQRCSVGPTSRGFWALESAIRPNTLCCQAV